MRNRRRPDLQRSQKSIMWFLEESKGDPKLNQYPDYYALSYPHMLIQDVAHSVVPTYGYTKKQFTIGITPSDDQVERIIEDGLATRDNGRGLPSAVCNFVQQCASTLMAYEQANYEIAYLLNSEQKPVAFLLARIPPRTLIRKGERLMQYVPETIARRRNLSSQYVELLPDDIIIFELPEYVRYQFGKTLEALAIKSNRVMPEFVLQNMQGETNIPFDFAMYNRSQKMALAEATKIIGWNARQSFSDHTLEYYMLHRQLKFEKFKVELRNTILETLNIGLAHAGKEVGFTAKIHIDGLPTLIDVETAQHQLAMGNHKFEEIMKPFWLY